MAPCVPIFLRVLWLIREEEVASDGPRRSAFSISVKNRKVEEVVGEGVPGVLSVIGGDRRVGEVRHVYL